VSRGGVVVVGGGHGGIEVATWLRRQKYAGDVALLCGEGVLPYQRPPLSKEALISPESPAPLPLRQRALLDRAGIELVFSRVVAVDRTSHTVQLDDGSKRTYEHLVLATGATPRGEDLSGRLGGRWHRLHTFDDAQGLWADIASANTVTVLGGGVIGLEVAAAARGHGVAVDVVEASERAMARMVSPATSERLAAVHLAHDVRLHFDSTITTVRGDKPYVVHLADGQRLNADVLLAAIGSAPNDTLARMSGLTVDGGIIVDSCLRTVDHSVYAIGDCARFPAGNATIRLESVQNAVDQARHVANVIATGNDHPCRAVPWFWSRQYGSMVQIAGYGDTDEDVVDDHGDGGFSVFAFDREQITIVESFNRPSDHALARRLLRGGRPIAPRELRDLGFYRPIGHAPTSQQTSRAASRAGDRAFSVTATE